MSNKVDFTGCRQFLGRAYNGANGKKIAVEYSGDIYMLKFPPSGEKKPTNLSYVNSCISEHIASNIFNMLGIKAQETVLGTYSSGGKTRLVCGCRDFTSGGKLLFDFCSIKNSIIDSESDGMGTELDEILETIEKQQFVNPEKLKKHFWDMFAADALLGNFDRHNGNWGFLYDSRLDRTEIAPVYDCGSCLHPQADEELMKKIINDEDMLNARIFRFPASAIKYNGKKINYFEFIYNRENSACIESVKGLYERVDMKKIASFIDEVPYITEGYKEFYKYYIKARLKNIIEPVCES